MKTITFLRWNAKHFQKLLFAIIFALVIYCTSSAADGTVVTVKYYSTTQSDSCLMNIYLPPGYNDVSDTNKYPVFYLMHGGGENYTFWITSGRADDTLNKYISEEKVVPMILVMPDGKSLAPATFSNEIRNDVIPYIELNYRTIADKDHRGIGGLSMGGQQSLEVGILHYEMFGYMAILSSGYFSTDNYNKAKTFLETNTNAADLEKSMRYFYFAEGTSYDLAYASGMQTLKLFRDNDITVHYWEYPGGHQWTVWREDFRSFIPYLFRDSTTRYISLEFQGGRIKNSTIMTNLDSLAPAPPDPTRTGYSFSGWYTEAECIDSFDFSSDTVKSNFTLYANWNINSYEISFNSNGGNYTPDAIIANYNTIIAEPAEPQNTGLYFAGWYTDTTFTKKWNFSIDKVTKDDTLIAKWSDYTSIYENQNSEISIYPNPAQSYFQIFNLQSDALVEIYNMEGKLLIHKDIVNSNAIVEIEKLPQGIYSILINCQNRNYYHKLIKQ